LAAGHQRSRRNLLPIRDRSALIGKPPPVPPLPLPPPPSTRALMDHRKSGGMRHFLPLTAGVEEEENITAILRVASFAASFKGCNTKCLLTSSRIISNSVSVITVQCQRFRLVNALPSGEALLRVLATYRLNIFNFLTPIIRVEFRCSFNAVVRSDNEAYHLLWCHTGFQSRGGR
jgi:hypothetical protein